MPVARRVAISDCVLMWKRGKYAVIFTDLSAHCWFCCVRFGFLATSPLHASDWLLRRMTYHIRTELKSSQSNSDHLRARNRSRRVALDSPRGMIASLGCHDVATGVDGSPAAASGVDFFRGPHAHLMNNW